MTDFIAPLSLLLALPAIAATILAQVELWQRKEYRLDRLLAAARGPELRLRALGFLLLMLLALGGFGLAVIIAAAADRSWFVLKRGITRPDWTLKAALLTALTAAFVGAAAFLALTHHQVAAALAYTIVIIPPAVAVAAVLTNIIGAARKQDIIHRAHRLRRSLPELIVIGITGSFGKTSTKHFLSQLLPSAAASREHRNSAFPIAQDILEQLPRHPGIYLVEMAAYRRGEIATLARLTSPRFGVITAIGNQHQATFGSPDNILRAKWELIAALPAHGTAVLNADDDKLRSSAATIKTASIIWYSTSHEADVFSDEISIESRQIRCRLHIKEFAQSVTIPLAGRGALSNVLAAVAAATAAGAKPEELFSRVQRLRPFPRTMELMPGIGGATVIDDSYSANERGVLDAVAHLAACPHRDKRIALLPLIELGEAAADVHRRIGQALGQSGAKVFIYGRAYSRELGAGQGEVQAITSPADLADALTTGAGPDTLLLLEGRIPEMVRLAALAAEKKP